MKNEVGILTGAVYEFEQSKKVHDAEMYPIRGRSQRNRGCFGSWKFTKVRRAQVRSEQAGIAFGPGAQIRSEQASIPFGPGRQIRPEQAFITPIPGAQTRSE